MEKIIQFLNEATISLTRASGLSISISKCALGLDILSNELHITESIHTVKPSSAEEGRKLHEAGVKLYNVTNRGPQNDTSLLKIRLLACEAMDTSGGFSASDVNYELKQLDSMRSYSRVGLLLLSVSERTLGRQALDKALHKTDDVLKLIQKCHGETQEGHDAASSYFAALCGFSELEFELLSSWKKDEEIGKMERVLKLVQLLKRNTELIGRTHSKNQHILRNIIEKGIQFIGVEESIPFQRILFEDWQEFTSSSPQLNLVIACRLAFSLAKLRDSFGSIAALECAEAIEMDMNENSLPSKTDKQLLIHLMMARCSVANVKLRDELKIQNLLTRADSEIETETNLKIATSVEELKQNCFKLLDVFVMNSNLNQTSLNHVIDDNNDNVLNILLGLSSDLCSLTSCVRETYGLLLGKFPTNLAMVSKLLLHLLRHGGDAGKRWVSSQEATDIIQQIGEKCDSQTRIRISMELWNECCSAHAIQDWKLVSSYSNLVFSLCNEEDGQDMLSRSLIARGLSSMNLLIPDKEGNALQETIVLNSTMEFAKKARDNTSLLDLKNTAVILELRCLVRLCAINNTKNPSSDLIMACSKYLQEGVLKPQDLMQVADESSAVDPTNVTIPLAIFECSRNFMLQEIGLNKSFLKQVVKKMILIRLKTAKYCEASQDVLSWIEYENVSKENDKEMKDWLYHIVTTQARSKEPKCLEEGLEVASLLLASSQVTTNKNEEDDAIAAAAGILVEIAIRSISLQMTPIEISLIVLCGERASHVISTLSIERKKNDPRIGTCCILAFLFMAISTPNSDEAVAERVVAACDDNEFVFPKREGLFTAAIIGRKLKFVKTARQLLIRVVQYELQESVPDYNRIVGDCISRLLQDSLDGNEIIEWTNQIESIRKVTQLSPETLEKVSLILWKKRAILGESELLSLACDWLQVACSNNIYIKERRESDLQAMKAYYTLPKCDLSRATADAHSNNFKEDQSTVTDDVESQEEEEIAS